jgi:D-alanyl-D-alanine dipeptidase
MSEYSLEASATAGAAVRCQAALISAMKNSGFCVSRSQVWHFENPKLTRNCFF